MIEIFGSKHQQHSRVVWMEAKVIVTIPMQRLPFIVMLLISHTDIIPRYKLLIMQLALNTQYLFFLIVKSILLQTNPFTSSHP